MSVFAIFQKVVFRLALYIDIEDVILQLFVIIERKAFSGQVLFYSLVLKNNLICASFPYQKWPQIVQKSIG